MRALARRALSSVTALVLACLAVLPAGAKPSQATRLLKLRPDALADPARTLSSHGIERWTPLDVPGWIRVTVAEPQLAYMHLERDPDVLVVEEDHRLRSTLVPNDPYWGDQWGADRINAPAAWDVTTGSANVVVAILDTGVDVDHSDLVGQLWINPGEEPGNGIDDDGNGKVDDVNGWRFLHDSLDDPYESDEIDDDHGHGTHVAGILAARGNNAEGIAGMAWNCPLMVVKVLDGNGDGWYSDVANGLVYAADNGARIANVSLGGPDDSQLMADALDYAHARGTLVVAAAGNSGTPGVLYPAAYESALAIAASDASDGHAAYSNYGPPVDLTAPGTSIYSTCRGDAYCYKSGTSMAVPYVSGLAALILSGHPTYTTTQVTQWMVDTARDIEAPGWDEYTGWGLVDARVVLSTTTELYVLYFPIYMPGAAIP